MMIRTLASLVAGATLAIGAAGPALAHDCFVAKKPPTAGATVLISEDANGEEVVTPLKPNPGSDEKPHGAFVAFAFGGFSGSTFIKAPGDGILPPARVGGSQYNCDGKGLDAFTACSVGE